MPYELQQAGQQVQTSVGSVLERVMRCLGWSKRYILGCGDCPCDFCSAPTPDYVYELDFNAAGEVSDQALDLSCVMPSEVEHGKRVICINNRVRDCELTGCEGVSIRENCKIYLTHCEENPVPVTVYLKNNGAPVTHDEFGNPVPASFLIGGSGRCVTGDVKYLCVVNGHIRGIKN